MTEQEKIEYRRRRLMRACAACASSKRKCNHDRTNQEPRAVERIELTSPVSKDVPEQDTELSFRPSTSIEMMCDRIYTQALARADAASVYMSPVASPTVRKALEEPEDSWDDGDSGNVDSPSSDKETLFLHKPQSKESLSMMIFAENNQWAGVADTWFGEAPVRLGHDTCYDLAVDALMMVCWYGRKLPGASLAKIYRLMGASLSLLHDEMSKEGAILNDHVLTTVAALSPVDAITTGHSFLVSSHLDGVAMILASQAAAKPLSSVARRILEFHFCDTYVMATVRGATPPFEAIDLSYCEYIDHSKPLAERKTRTIGNKLCVRLPRLIMLVRLACGVQSDSFAVASALNLASELLELRDDLAESEFLESVGVTSSKLLHGRQITELSLNYKSLSSLEAGTYYWHTRITLLRLCCRLRSSFPTFSYAYALPSALEMQHEMQRHASNIVMSVQFAYTNTARKRRRLLGQSLIACWSTLEDFPNTLTSECTADKIRSWLLQNVNMTLLGVPDALDAHDLNEAAELFRGGPLVGMYKDLYDPPVTVHV